MVIRAALLKRVSSSCLKCKNWTRRAVVDFRGLTMINYEICSVLTPELPKTGLTVRFVASLQRVAYGIIHNFR